MSWAIGYDAWNNRDIGYGVPAVCDHPDCSVEIDRGLSYVCGGSHYGGENGCGLYFCGDHLAYKLEDGSLPKAKPMIPLCDRCLNGAQHFDPKPDTLKWIGWKLSDTSWQQWRDENPGAVAELGARIAVSSVV